MTGELNTPEEAVNFRFPDKIEDEGIEQEAEEKEDGQFGTLFIQAPYGGDAIQFRGEPTSLLYAVSVFADRVHNGDLDGLDDNDLKIMNPAVFDDKFKAELIAYIEEKKPKVIGISCTTSSSVPANEIAQIAKSSAKLAGYEIITVMGGAHERDMASMLPDGTSAEQQNDERENPVDLYATGESEETFNLLLSLVYESRTPEEIEKLTAEELKTLLASDEIQAKFKELSGRDGGFAFKLNDESRRISTNGKPIDYEKVPPLPRHLLDQKWTKYYGIFRKNGRDVKTAQIMSCRGCAKKCRFCSETLNFHPKDAEIVTQEIDRIARKQEGVEPYKAVFFDDSTFTAFTKEVNRPDGTISRESRSIDNLRPVFEKLKEHNLEWGCQTRVDCIDEDLVREMKEAGCTYIYLGVESANQEMLNAMGKGVTVEQIEKAIDIIDAAGIRIGMSLMFGSEGEINNKRIEESESSVDDTFAFVKRKIDEGKNITLVSMNLYTYYPYSTATKHMPREEKIRLAKEGYPDREDLESLSEEDLLKLTFNKPIVHHGYPWNRFEDGQGHHTRCASDEKLARYIIEHGIKEIGEVLQGQDLYTVGEVYEEIRTGKIKDYVDLNHASLTTPKLTERQREYVFRGLNGEEAYDSHDDWSDEIDFARACFADLLGVKHGKGKLGPEVSDRSKILGSELKALEQIVFARNTTEATSLAFWIAGLDEETTGKCIYTDAENPSIPRLLKVNIDHSNPHGRDDWTTFQDFGTQKQNTGHESTWSADAPFVSKEKDRTLNRMELVKFNLTEQSEQEIVKLVDGETRLAIISHVVRDDGRIIDVKSVCDAIKEKNPDAYIIVDGAQSMGALPPFSVEDIGCDFYVGTPHKTLNSFPFGVLWMSERAMEKLPEFFYKYSAGKVYPTIKDHMFSNADGHLTSWIGSRIESMRLHGNQLRKNPGIEFRNEEDMESAKKYNRWVDKYGSADVSERVLSTRMEVIADRLSPQEITSFAVNMVPAIKGVDREELDDFDSFRTLKPDMYDWLGSPQAINRFLESNEDNRKNLKSSAIKELISVFGSDVEIISPQDGKHSNFILSFRFPSEDNRQIVDKLWRLPKPFTLSYIARSDLIRISFDQFNTEGEINNLVDELSKLAGNNRNIEDET